MKLLSISLSILFFTLNASAQFSSYAAFNGSNSRVQLGGVTSSSVSSITIEAWINTKSKTISNQYSEIIRQDRFSGAFPDFLLSFQPNGVNRILSFGLFTTNGYSELDLPIDTVDFMNNWVHVAAVYTGSNMYIYQNGTLLGSAPKTGTIVYNPFAGRTNLGASSYGGGYGEFFQGSIDEVRIWTTARSQEQIISTMNDTLTSEYYTSADSSLIGYWRFDENSGTSANDLSVSGNHGTLVNSVFQSEESLPVEMISFSFSGSKLLWSTATETNNAGWEIEGRQLTTDNGQQMNSEFRKIGFVAGKGTTTEKQNYSFASSITYNASQLQFRLKQIDSDGKFTYSNVLTVNLTPESFGLSQNFPNPFNPSTLISYQLKANSFVSLKVFDLLGREVKTLVNEEKPAGSYSLNFSAVDLPNGVYFYKLTAGNFSETKKMMLVK